MNVVQVGLLLVGVFSVHELGDGQVKHLLHVALLPVLVKMGLHPLVENRPSVSHHLEQVAGPQEHRENQLSVLDLVRGEAISELSLQECHDAEVLRHVCFQHYFNYKFPHFSVNAVGDVLHDIALVLLQDKLESSSQVVVLQNTVVRISDGNWMLGPHNELIGVSRVLKVMDDIGHEHCEHIVLLHQVLKASHVHNVVHGLKGVNDMVLVMVSVFLEVALADLNIIMQIRIKYKNLPHVRIYKRSRVQCHIS